MNTDRLIFILGVVFFVLAVCVFVYTAVGVVRWKKTTDKLVQTLSEEIHLYSKNVTHLEGIVTLNDKALSEYIDIMRDVLEHNDQIIKDNSRLSSELSVLALDIRGARDESTGVSDDGSGSDDTAL